MMVNLSYYKLTLFGRTALFVFVDFNIHAEPCSAGHGIRENGNYAKVRLLSHLEHVQHVFSTLSE